MPQISEAVRRDQRLVKSEFERLLHTTPAERPAPSDFIWALDRYLIVEDLVLTPALENHVARGGERRRRLSDDFESMNLKLRHMRQYDTAEPSFDAAMHAIWVDLEPHIREEASEDLDRLEQNMARSDSEALGRKYEHIKELLQKPYGKGGVPDERTLDAILEMPRQELMTKLGVYT
ncbi:hypothetical protein QBC34DRAFT_411899 [Podospora aff. communis PSN243]|uniref:Hemerythrin-like domain-containing protein n=1 Tax=Podospora aff. communis PSN243 TaxID=3040156 RepID=A0AAV9GDY1_9PEZI|nr:hypothetical protein QBC34DRAFT_411899 [Podospora aff. communis PSN243]